ncbi:MAG: DUF3634 family protein [Polyangiaceae bacterium]
MLVDHLELIVLAVVFVVALLLWSRAHEVCAISVRDGALLVVRGRAPQVLVNDIAEVMRRAGAKRSMVRIVKEGGGARITASGVDEATQQRLRNVLGAHPYRLLASAPPPVGRNLGQILGIAWLAWFFSDRR